MTNSQYKKSRVYFQDNQSHPNSYKDYLRTLDECRSLQQQFIPKHPFELNRFKVSSLYRPSFFLSGDFFDYVALDKHKIAIFVLDVIGKGISASFTTIWVKSIFYQIIKQINDHSPKSVLHTLNNALFHNVSLDRKGGYGFFAILDTQKQSLTYSHCGIGLASLYRNNAIIELNQFGGSGIGLFDNTVYSQGSINLLKNDTIIISSDGIEDAKNIKGHRLGLDWINSIVFNNRKPINQKRLISKLDNFIKMETGNNKRLEDDIACVCIEF